MTTDLELGRPTVWDLTTLAARDQAAVASAYRQRILASASVPPMFPPVEIEGSLHADGGASHIFFLGPRADLLDNLTRQLVKREVASETALRVWVIVSSPLWPSIAAISDRWPTITYRYGALGLYALTRADLQRIRRPVDRAASHGLKAAELRFVAVPRDLTRPSTLASPAFVRELRATGERLGRRGRWSRSLTVVGD